jgi:hypothetical protein
VDRAAATSRGPAAFHFGPGHLIVYGNEPFIEAFGAASLGQPAREALVGWPPEAFELMDRVYRDGRPLARRIVTPDGPRRLVVVPRRDPETGETYGVTSHLRPADPAPGHSSDPNG